MANGFRYSFAPSEAGLSTTYTGAGTSTSPSFTFVGDNNGTFTIYGRIIDKNDMYSDYTIQVVVTDVQISSGGCCPNLSYQRNVNRCDHRGHIHRRRWSRNPVAVCRDDRLGRRHCATAGTIGSPVNGVYSVLSTHTYATQGNYTVRVVFVHDSLPSVSITDEVTSRCPCIDR